MDFNKKDVAIGFMIIVVVVSGAYLYKKLKTPQISLAPTPAPIDYQKDLEDSFKYDIPDGVNSIELKDVSGGSGRGIATQKEILADIEDPVIGYFYQGWLQKGDNYVSLGKLQVAKGGWLLEYNSAKLVDAEKIIVSLEKNFDTKIEKKVLEGSFK